MIPPYPCDRLFDKGCFSDREIVNDNSLGIKNNYLGNNCRSRAVECEPLSLMFLEMPASLFVNFVGS